MRKEFVILMFISIAMTLCCPAFSLRIDRNYAYNANGSLTKDLNRQISNITYDNLGNVQRISFPLGKRIDYVYAADGRRQRTIHTQQVFAGGSSSAGDNTSPHLPVMTVMQDSTDYVGNLILRNGHPSQYRSKWDGHHYSLRPELQTSR